MHDFPEYVHYYTIKKYRYPGTPASNDSNRNLLLFRDPTVDGPKTGHTKAAGYCLVATAKRDFPNLQGRRLVSVVLGASSEAARANESQKLLNWGCRPTRRSSCSMPASPWPRPRWKGKTNELKLGRNEPIVVAVPSGTAAQVKTEIARPEPLIAPFRQAAPRHAEGEAGRAATGRSAAGGAGAGGGSRLLRPRLGRDAFVDQQDAGARRTSASSFRFS